MELTIAIWEDCKRLLTDNQPITCRRLQPFADIKVHVEALAATAGAETEEVGIVGHLDLALLAGDVNGNRNALSICIEDVEIGIIGMHLMLLIHQT